MNGPFSRDFFFRDYLCKISSSKAPNPMHNICLVHTIKFIDYYKYFFPKKKNAVAKAINSKHMVFDGFPEL